MVHYNLFSHLTQQSGAGHFPAPAPVIALRFICFHTTSSDNTLPFSKSSIASSSLVKILFTASSIV